MNLGFWVPLLVAVALTQSCEEDGLFSSLRPEASLHYYNQITSDEKSSSNLVVDLTVEGDKSDSVSGVGYSGKNDGPELNVRIRENKKNQDNSVRLEGVNPTSGTLFRSRARLSNDNHYTVVSYGDTSKWGIDVGVFQQNQSEVSSGNARFRVINTVNPDILNTFSFDLRYNDSDQGQYFTQELGLGDASGYQVTDTGRLNLVVVKSISQDGGGPEQRVDGNLTCSLNSGRTYDVILAVRDPLDLPTSVSDAEDELAIYCHPHPRT